MASAVSSAVAENSTGVSSMALPAWSLVPPSDQPRPQPPISPAVGGRVTTPVNVALARMVASGTSTGSTAVGVMTICPNSTTV